MNHTFKGTIALDIDGTLTTSPTNLPSKTKLFLEHLARNWRLIFITGRTFSFAHPILKSFNEPYLFSLQNGSSLYEMPLEKKLLHHFIDSSLLSKLETLFSDEEQGFVIESGKENQDKCYYKKKEFSKEDLEYLHFRMNLSSEPWQNVDAFNSLPIKGFPVAKFFSKEDKALLIQKKLLALFPHQLNVNVIRDPFREGYHLTLITEAQATKGKLLKNLLKEEKGPLIVAGDDYNDVEMLKVADIKIVMKNAPHALHSMADIIAPSVEEEGIITALNEATQCK